MEPRCNFNCGKAARDQIDLHSSSEKRTLFKLITLTLKCLEKFARISSPAPEAKIAKDLLCRISLTQPSVNLEPKCA